MNAIRVMDSKTGQIVVVAIIGAVALWYVTNKAKAAADLIGAPIGNAIAKVQQFINGNHAIDSTQAAIPLTDLSVRRGANGSYFINQSKREALAAMHPQNAVILATIFTSNNELMPQYVSFVNVRAVTLGDI
jgi:hypothetical protein